MHLFQFLVYHKDLMQAFYSATSESDKNNYVYYRGLLQPQSFVKKLLYFTLEIKVHNIQTVEDLTLKQATTISLTAIHFEELYLMGYPNWPAGLALFSVHAHTLRNEK